MRYLLAVAPVLLCGCDPITPEPPREEARGNAADRIRDSVRRPNEVPLAIRAAFPEGTGVESGNPQSLRRFDDHRLVEAPFGPVLVSRGHVPAAAHVDSGEIAVHYLAREGEGFRMVRAFPKTVVLGSSGDLASWSMTGIYTSLPAILAEGGYTGQGIGCSWTQLVELTPDGPVTVARFLSGFDNKGALGSRGEAFTGSIDTVYQDRSFTVRYSGTRSFTERYVRKGAIFAIEGTPATLPDC